MVGFAIASSTRSRRDIGNVDAREPLRAEDERPAVKVELAPVELRKSSARFAARISTSPAARASFSVKLFDSRTMLSATAGGRPRRSASERACDARLFVAFSSITPSSGLPVGDRVGRSDAGARRHRRDVRREQDERARPTSPPRSRLDEADDRHARVGDRDRDLLERAHESSRSVDRE